MATAAADAVHQFEVYRRQVGHDSPLYGRLAHAVPNDAELLALSAQARRGQPLPLVLFGAVHYLLLGETAHPLSAWYPTVTGGAPPPPQDPFPEFRRFCLERRDELAAIISTRLTQTNEVGRCAVMLPGLALAVERGGGRPLTHIEVGCSAGLMLLWDRYYYDFGAAGTWGPDSMVRLECQVRSAGPLPLPPAAKVADRMGVDLNPIDVTDPDQARWLAALVWPEHVARFRRLLAAVELARLDPPRLVAGDAIEAIGGLIAAAHPDTTVLVSHSMALNQFTRTAREELDEVLRQSGRPLLRLWMEWIDTDLPRLALLDYHGGRVERLELADYQYHGRWIDWRGPPSEG